MDYIVAKAFNQLIDCYFQTTLPREGAEKVEHGSEIEVVLPAGRAEHVCFWHLADIPQVLANLSF